MKKIISPATKETAVYYSDFSGKYFDEFGPHAEVVFNFNYGSKYDSGRVKLHLSDQEAEQVLDFIKTKLSKDCVEFFKKVLHEEGIKYDDAMDFRDWSSWTEIASSRELVKRLAN